MGYQELLIKTEEKTITMLLKEIEQYRQQDIYRSVVNPVEFVATAKENFTSYTGKKIKAGEMFVVLSGDRGNLSDFVSNIRKTKIYAIEDLLDPEIEKDGDYQKLFNDTSAKKYWKSNTVENTLTGDKEKEVYQDEFYGKIVYGMDIVQYYDNKQKYDQEVRYQQNNNSINAAEELSKNEFLRNISESLLVDGHSFLFGSNLDNDYTEELTEWNINNTINLSIDPEMQRMNEMYEKVHIWEKKHRLEEKNCYTKEDGHTGQILLNDIKEELLKKRYEDIIENEKLKSNYTAPIYDTVSYSDYSQKNQASSVLYDTASIKPASKSINVRKAKEDYVTEQKEKLMKVNLQIKNLAMSYVKDPKQIAELLEFGSHFYHYSARNTMLIMQQNEGATYVQSYEKWKESGYAVKRGQKGLKVLVPVMTTYLKVPGNDDKYIKLSNAPKELQNLYKQNKIDSVKKRYYTLGNVFDISQTNCPKQKYPEFYSMGYEDVDQDKVIAGITNLCEDKLGIPVNTVDLQSISLRGYYRPLVKDITLNSLLNSTEKLSTLTHELGHAMMEHGGYNDIGNTYQKEFEADCFSIMVDKHLGIPITNSRKFHLAENFKAMEKNYLERDIDYDFNNIVSDVFNRYSSIVDDMNQYIDKELEIGKEAAADQEQSADHVYKKSSIMDKMIDRNKGLTNEYEVEMA